MARSKGQGSVTRCKDGVYMGRITKNGITKTFYHKNKKIVESKLLEFSKMYELKKDNNIKFSQYVHDYLYTYKYMHIKASSFDRLDSVYRNHIAESSIGSIPMSQLSDIVIQQYINAKVASGLSLSSCKKIFELIRSILAYAYKKGDIVIDYSALIRLPNINHFKDVKHIETYSKEECNILVNYIWGRYEERKRFLRYAPCFIVMLYSGLRAGELLALKWSDVDFDNRVISVKNSVSVNKQRGENQKGYTSVVSSTKTLASKRCIPLNDDCYNALLELKKRYCEFDCMCDYVVCNLKGDFIKLRSLEHKLELICDSCGIMYKGVHALRHTFASQLIECGVAPKVVSELLGHTNVVFTLNRYVHTNEEQKKQAVSML